jgi:hypothetical protein
VFLRYHSFIKNCKYEWNFSSSLLNKILWLDFCYSFIDVLDLIPSEEACSRFFRMVFSVRGGGLVW